MTDIYTKCADQAERIKELEAERNAYRNTAISLREHADKLMQRGDNFKEQLAASQARERVLRDALKVSHTDSDYQHQQLFLRALSTPSDDTALREYGAKLLEEMAQMMENTRCEDYEMLLCKAKELKER